MSKDIAERLRILFVEDSEDDVALSLRQLSKAGFETEFERVETKAALEEALHKEWDLVLSDFQMPSFDGLAAFKLVRKMMPQVPFIFVSGVLGEERAVAAMRAGAKDYVLKGQLDRLAPVVSREFADAKVRKQRAELEKTLKAERKRHQSVFRSASVALIELHFEGQRSNPRADARINTKKGAVIRAANKAAAALFAIDDETDLIGGLESTVAGESVELWAGVSKAMAGPTGSAQFDCKVRHGDQFKEVLVTMEVPDAPVSTVVLCLVDVSETRAVERQLRAAQRMESIARITGGVAHDFNNMITVVDGYAEFLLDELEEGSPLRDDVEVIRSVSGKAEKLTRQLVAFSRRQIVQPRILDINVVTQELLSMIERVIGADISVTTKLAPKLDSVLLDSGQVEQLLMNLILNARDAMSAGGDLTIMTDNVVLTKECGAMKPAEIVPGAYVVIGIEDSGQGIPHSVQKDVFEPFFSHARDPDHTGLGLSTVYGIVKQASGYVWVYSEPGKGTVVRCYFPKHESVGKSVRPSAPVSLKSNTETVLVVEDNDLVRRTAERALRRAGFTVLSAATGEEALRIAEREGDKIALTLTDMIMPKMSGGALGKRLLEKHTGMKVIYMSGYSNDMVSAQGLIDEGAQFIQKPFTPKQLELKLRTLLDSPELEPL